jgi:hypothetical protein
MLQLIIECGYLLIKIIFGNHIVLKAEDIIGKHVRYQKNANWIKDEYQFILPRFEQYEEKVMDMNFG